MSAGLYKKIIFVMGVSGSGKSTVGQLVANKLSMPFIDADDHHLPSSIEKMAQGIPLSDSDRMPWLTAINKLAIEHLGSGSGVVIACSALKKKYRDQLNQSVEANVNWVYLKGDYDLIFERMKTRSDHFMGASMLKSQFEILQEPEHAITVDIAASLSNVVDSAVAALTNHN